MPSLSHHTDSLLNPNRALGLEGNAVVGANGSRQAKFLEYALKHRESIGFLGGRERLAGDEIAAGEVGDGQRIAISPIGKHELALVIGTPQFIRLGRARQCSALSPVASSGSALDQAVAIEHGMNRADRRRMHIRIKPRQSFADLGRSPTRLVLLQAHDQRLDLDRQLVGMAIGPARAVGKPFQARRVVTCEDFVAGLARDAELSAQARHLFSVQKLSNELQTLIHGSTRLPGHFALPAKSPIV